MFDKKIYISNVEYEDLDGDKYPRLPEGLLNSSAKKMVERMRRVFPSLSLDLDIIEVIYDNLKIVDEIVWYRVRGAFIDKKSLRTLIDITLEKEVMWSLSRAAARYGVDSVEEDAVETIPPDFF